ncbi:MAG: ligase-associated DNA damage response endonuclease PdeM [Hyphomonadaceae bacterium]|nr:ligase-associated DNA damage response endonuclease PdeM [Hyphomonadaceae bacterium]
MSEPTPAPAFIRNGDGVHVRVGATEAETHAEGALFIAAHGALVVSDLHLEKGSSFALRGQLIPPYDTRATLKRLAALIERLKPDIVVSLGDSFHDIGGPARMAPMDRKELKRLVGKADWVWIEGNHDPEIPGALGGRTMRELRLGELTLRHEPREGAARGEIAGHLHPCARVSSRGRSVRARCFAADGERLVMPAFGAYAGGLNVRDVAFAPIFPAGAAAVLMGRGKLYPVAGARLIADA